MPTRPTRRLTRQVEPRRTATESPRDEPSYSKPHNEQIVTSRTTIPVSRETRERLAEEKRDEKTWDEFLRRLSTDEPIEFGAWSDETAAQAMERLRENRGRG